MKGRASNGQKINVNVTCYGLHAIMHSTLHLPLKQAVGHVLFSVLLLNLIL